MDEIKRRHHYVWRHYLGAWAANGKIWCRRHGRAFCADLMTVAQQRDFYKLRPLSNQDSQWLRLMISQQDARLRRTNNSLVEFFEFAGAVSVLHPSPHVDPVWFSHEQAKIMHNTEEDLFSQIEGDGVEYLRQLHEGDSVFLKERRLRFLRFLASQYLRTKGVQQTIAEALKPSMLQFGAEIDSCWQVLRHVFANNLALSLAADASMDIHLLTSAADLPLITGDQPVINTLGSRTRGALAPTDVELYYPVGPRSAVLVSCDPAWHRQQRISDVHVRRFNDAMVDHSFEQVFASTESDLSRSK